MTNEELRKRLGEIGDTLVPVAGELMRRACGDRDEHDERCGCNTCKAFLATHKAINDLEEIMCTLEK